MTSHAVLAGVIRHVEEGVARPLKCNRQETVELVLIQNLDALQTLVVSLVQDLFY